MTNRHNRQTEFELGKHSLIGDRYKNQDRCLIARSRDTLLLALADGMGGHPRGEVAAQIFVDLCERWLSRQPGPIADPRDFLVHTFTEAHREMQKFGRRQSPPIEPRTTAVAVLLQGGSAFWAHAGDSRLYLFRNQALLFRTLDHSYVERLRRQGMIRGEQLARHPMRNVVTRCLGGEEAMPQPACGRSRLHRNDRLLLCSDGLWSGVHESVMIDTLFSNALGMQETAEALAREAVATVSPESDNVSLVACRVLTQPFQGDVSTHEDLI